MQRKFIVFSSILFLLIFVLGGAVFIFLMGRILHDNAVDELMQVVEIEKLKLESYVNNEVAIVWRMAASPLIQQYFLNPDNEEAAIIALEEIEGYRMILAPNSIFWVNDKDKKFYMDGGYAYTVDTDDPDHYWYNMTMYETQVYNFNINYNPSLKVTNLWINAPVFDREHKPLGILGIGINLSDFINTINTSYYGPAELHFFNALGEITGARDIELVANKIMLDTELGQTGSEILARAVSLKDGEIKCFETKDRKGMTALCRIPALGWYISAVYHFTAKRSLQTGMAFLFGVMMAVIFSIFVIINIFVSILLYPLNRLTKTLRQISCEWDLKPQGEENQKDEVETLGEFLNMTIIDQLTGIYNRRFLNGNLKKIIRSLSRSGGRLSLLLVDIDYFKKYNDTYGHDMGDICLRTVANALAGCITREEDFIVRYGGEEFAVILPNTGEDGADFIAERMLKVIHECNMPHEKSDVADFVTVSIGGMSCVVKYSHNERDFIKRADEALYKSKQEGRNRYTFKSLD